MNALRSGRIGRIPACPVDRKESLAARTPPTKSIVSVRSQSLIL